MNAATALTNFFSQWEGGLLVAFPQAAPISKRYHSYVVLDILCIYLRTIEEAEYHVKTILMRSRKSPVEY